MVNSRIILATAVLTLTATAAVVAFIPPVSAPNLDTRQSPLNRPRQFLSRASQSQLTAQAPMNPGPVLPSDQDKPDHSGNDQGSLTISDVLPKTRQINIFASLTRDIPSISSRLSSSKPEDSTTLLAPLNSAMQSLPRKPWEDAPGGVSGAREGASDEDKAAQNLERFVLGHVVPRSPWREGNEGRISTLSGQEVWWEEDKEGRRVLMPGKIEVDSVVGKVGNGEVWILKGTLHQS